MSAQLILGALLLCLVPVLIWAELNGQRGVTLIVKPIATLMVIATAIAGYRMAPTSYGLLIGIGLLVSLAGDIALMFSGNRRAFAAGLVFFLIAHGIYVAAFSLRSAFGRPDAVNAGIMAIIGAALYVRFRPRLGAMKAPVAFYIVLISLMVNRAYGVVWSSPAAGAGCVALGATLFYISDVMLAWNRFASPFRLNRLSLAPYYGGQYCIALSACCMS
jgi:uncharacterized membrane protein YhhN